MDCGRVECIAAHLAQEHGTAVDLQHSRRPTFNLNLNIPGDIKCHICNETFASYSVYSTHLEEQHGQASMEAEVRINLCMNGGIVVGIERVSLIEIFIY